MSKQGLDRLYPIHPTHESYVGVPDAVAKLTERKLPVKKVGSLNPAKSKQRLIKLMFVAT